MDIHKAGGGIHFTVEHTKNSTEEKLYESFTDRLNKFIKSGTTFVECKSGYGLEWETEHKMLKVITKAKREFRSIGISSTYLGGHAVPRY
jgi:imidazolonepropionase